jgi:putative PIN family toxin of toxin-antitoxin system
MRNERRGAGSDNLRVVFDTNIYFSAFRNPEGVLAQIFRAGATHRCRVILSREIIDEFADACREKLGTREEKIQEDIKAIVHAATEIVRLGPLPDAVPNDPDDNHILACALAGRADLIVSGDRHLLFLKEYEVIPIVRPVDFLRTLGSA